MTKSTQQMREEIANLELAIATQEAAEKLQQVKLERVRLTKNIKTRKGIFNHPQIGIQSVIKFFAENGVKIDVRIEKLEKQFLESFETWMDERDQRRAYWGIYKENQTLEELENSIEVIQKEINWLRKSALNAFRTVLSICENYAYDYCYRENCEGDKGLYLAQQHHVLRCVLAWQKHFNTGSVGMFPIK